MGVFDCVIDWRKIGNQKTLLSIVRQGSTGMEDLLKFLHEHTDGGVDPCRAISTKRSARDTSSSLCATSRAVLSR